MNVLSIIIRKDQGRLEASQMPTVEWIYCNIFMQRNTICEDKELLHCNNMGKCQSTLSERSETQMINECYDPLNKYFPNGQK